MTIHILPFEKHPFIYYWREECWLREKGEQSELAKVGQLV